MKKKTIFKLFIIPLIILMLIQAGICYGTIFFGGTTKLLDNYSVGNLTQTVENRKILLENSMVQQWSNVAEEVEQINSYLAQILTRESMEAAEFLSNKKLQDELLKNMLPNCLYMLRKNTVTGTMIILANTEIANADIDTKNNKETSTTEYECRGVYFRDSDPDINPGNYSDILIERGDSSFSHELGIPFDSLWTSEFHFKTRGEREADSFFYKPYEAAKKYPDTSYTNLAYWNPPFCLEGNSSKDSYQMITYTVPLVYKDGTVYGIIGIEISCKYLKERLPAKELSTNNQSGYMLALKQEDKTFLPLLYTGSGVIRITELNTIAHANTTEYKNFYKLYGDEKQIKEIYASVSTLHLYNKNTPFEKEVWVIAGLKGEEELFGIGKTILRTLFIVILIALVFGIISIYFIVSNVTSPIRRLAECIRSSTENKLNSFKESKIVEVDELYEVVKNLTEKQNEAEYKLLEEKERYKVALQSSTDIIFTYDIKEDSLQLLNFKSKRDYQRELFLKHVKKYISYGKGIAKEDKNLVLRVIENAKDEINEVFQMRMLEEENKYYFVELTGKVIYDLSQNRTKIIGSLKNVHEQKMKEILEEEAKHRDNISGLYQRKIGEKFIIEELEQGKRGSLILFALDHFRELNEQYGMVLGDTILEELGRILLDYKKKFHSIVVRIGRSEILLWLCEESKIEPKEFLELVKQEIQVVYTNSKMIFTISAGITKTWEEEPFSQLFFEAEQAFEFAKKTGGNQSVLYPEIPKEKLKEIGKAEFDKIVNVAYTENLNIVSLVFHFFDKGGSISNILPVLLAKLGRHFGFTDILVTTADWDFYTIYPAFYWSTKRSETTEQKIQYFSSSEFTAFAEEMKEESYEFKMDTFPLKKKMDFFMIPEKTQGICIPMYDNKFYMGAIVFAAKEASFRLGEKEKNNLVEIVKIIETNLKREKYDLASQAKSEFLSRMSHEIRTPMNAIMGMTAIALTEKKVPEKIENCLVKIEQSSKYLLSLINDILDMSKIESGKMKLEQANFNLFNLLDIVNNLIQTQAQDKQIIYQKEIDIKKPWVKGDFLHLNQVLINLLGNAVKFTPMGGVVCLTVKQEIKENETSLFFSVKDTGIGISKENIGRIFRSFEQAESSTTREYGGTGLGLPISSQLVRMMEGTIEVNSTKGVGSEFYFTIHLPFGEEEEKKEKAGAEDREAGNKEGKKRNTKNKEIKNKEKENKEIENRKIENKKEEIEEEEIKEKEIEEETQEGIEEIQEEIVDFTGKRVLIVEDNSINMEIAQTLLEMKGFIVENAWNGLEAVECFCNHPIRYYDVILMDIRMPVMDGLEATKQIRKLDREDAKEIAIVAMTANAFDEDTKKSIESGMDGHLAKPINLDEFFAMLEKVLKKEKNF